MDECTLNSQGSSCMECIVIEKGAALGKSLSVSIFKLVGDRKLYIGTNA